MTSSIRLCACHCLLVLASASAASAAPIVPTFGTFGSLPAATFKPNGIPSGIPNDAVAWRDVALPGGGSVRIGLSAHERFSNPPVGDNGAGVYSALPGANFGDPTFNTMPSALSGATWNFGYYIQFSGGATMANADIRLLYDFNPAANNDAATHGVIDFNAALAALAIPEVGVTRIEDSQNLNFNFLAISGGGITAPGGSFNPHAIGEYTFALQVYHPGTGNLLGQTAILVASTPEPASLAVWSLLAAGSAVVGWRRKRSQN